MTEPIRIVVIEDEAAIRRFLRAGLPSGDMAWFEAENAVEGIRLVAQKNPHVVLLDLGLPDRDGLEVLRELREWTDVPVIVLTARGQERDKVAALDGGADDYVTKPFSLAELMARIRVAVRHRERIETSIEPVFRSDGLMIDFAARQVWIDGQEARLTPTEYRLLAVLAQHAGKVVTHRQLLAEVWGPGFEEATHTLRVHMASIRQKVDPDPTRPRFIRTETGVGYRLMVGEA